MNNLGIIGLIALVVGLVLSTLSIRDYFVQPRMFPTWVEVLDNGDNTALVLFRLSFVNMSSKGRIVRDVKLLSSLGKITRIEIKEEVDSDRQNINYSLSNVSRQLPFVETLQPCLDIPPYQSRSRWMVFGLVYSEETWKRSDVLEFVAVGVGKVPREICRTYHQVILGKSFSFPIDLYPVAKKSILGID